MENSSTARKFNYKALFSKDFYKGKGWLKKGGLAFVIFMTVKGTIVTIGLLWVAAKTLF